VTRRASGLRKLDQLQEAASGKLCYRDEWEEGEFGMAGDRSIVVAGAGSIGCFVGGWLAAAGHRVALLARPRVIGEIESNGLTVTSFEGAVHHLAPGQLKLSDDPAILADA